MIEEAGDWSFSMRALASRVGVSPMAAYSHFADKTDLLAAVAAGGFADLEARTRAAASACEDPRQGMFELGLAYILFGVENPARYRLMFGPIFAVSQPPAMRGACDGAYSSLTEQIAKCAPPGGWPEGEAEMRALGSWSITHGFTMLMIDRPAGRLDEHGTSVEEIRRMAEIVLSLRPTPHTNHPLQEETDR